MEKKVINYDLEQNESSSFSNESESIEDIDSMFAKSKNLTLENLRTNSLVNKDFLPYNSKKNNKIKNNEKDNEVNLNSKNEEIENNIELNSFRSQTKMDFNTKESSLLSKKRYDFKELFIDNIIICDEVENNDKSKIRYSKSSSYLKKYDNYFLIEKSLISNKSQVLNQNNEYELSKIEKYVIEYENISFFDKLLKEKDYSTPLIIFKENENILAGIEQNKAQFLNKEDFIVIKENFNNFISKLNEYEKIVKKSLISNNTTINYNLNTNSSRNKEQIFYDNFNNVASYEEKVLMYLNLIEENKDFNYQSNFFLNEIKKNFELIKSTDVFVNIKPILNSSHNAIVNEVILYIDNNRFFLLEEKKNKNEGIFQNPISNSKFLNLLTSEQIDIEIIGNHQIQGNFDFDEDAYYDIDEINEGNINDNIEIKPAIIFNNHKETKFKAISDKDPNCIKLIRTENLVIYQNLDKNQIVNEENFSILSLNLTNNKKINNESVIIMICNEYDWSDITLKIAKQVDEEFICSNKNTNNRINCKNLIETMVENLYYTSLETFGNNKNISQNLIDFNSLIPQETNDAENINFLKTNTISDSQRSLREILKNEEFVINPLPNNINFNNYNNINNNANIAGNIINNFEIKNNITISNYVSESVKRTSCTIENKIKKKNDDIVNRNAKSTQKTQFEITNFNLFINNIDYPNKKEFTFLNTISNSVLDTNDLNVKDYDMYNEINKSPQVVDYRMDKIDEFSIRINSKQSQTCEIDKILNFLISSNNLNISDKNDVETLKQMLFKMNSTYDTFYYKSYIDAVIQSKINQPEPIKFNCKLKRNATKSINYEKNTSPYKIKPNNKNSSIKSFTKTKNQFSNTFIKPKLCLNLEELENSELNKESLKTIRKKRILTKSIYENLESIDEEVVNLKKIRKFNNKRNDLAIINKESVIEKNKKKINYSMSQVNHKKDMIESKYLNSAVLNEFNIVKGTNSSVNKSKKKNSRNMQKIRILNYDELNREDLLESAYISPKLRRILNYNMSEEVKTINSTFLKASRSKSRKNVDNGRYALNTVNEGKNYLKLSKLNESDDFRTYKLSNYKIEKCFDQDKQIDILGSSMYIERGKYSNTNNNERQTISYNFNENNNSKNLLITSKTKKTNISSFSYNTPINQTVINKSNNYEKIRNLNSIDNYSLKTYINEDNKMQDVNGANDELQFCDENFYYNSNIYSNRSKSKTIGTKNLSGNRLDQKYSNEVNNKETIISDLHHYKTIDIDEL